MVDISKLTITSIYAFAIVISTLLLSTSYSICNEGWKLTDTNKINYCESRDLHRACSYTTATRCYHIRSANEINIDFTGYDINVELIKDDPNINSLINLIVLNQDGQVEIDFNADFLNGSKVDEVWRKSKEGDKLPISLIDENKASFYITQERTEFHIGSESDIYNITVSGGSLQNNTVNDVFVTEAGREYIATNQELIMINASINTQITNITAPHTTVYVLSGQVYTGNSSGIFIYADNNSLTFNKSKTVNVSNVNEIKCKTINGEIICAIATAQGLKMYNTSSDTIINHTASVNVEDVVFALDGDNDTVIFANSTHLLRSTNITNVFNKEEYQSDSSMIAWHHMEDGNDSSTFKFNLTLTRGAELNGTEGRFRNAIKFNGTASNRATIDNDRTKANNTLFDGRKELTVMAWFKSNFNSSKKDANYVFLIAKFGGDTSLDRSWSFRHRDVDGAVNDRFDWTIVGDNDQVFSDEFIYTGARFLDGNWHHLAWVIDFTGGNLTTYYDGILENVSTTLNTSTQLQNGSFFRNVTIGCADVSCNQWNGSVDEVAIYDRALTSKEITDYYFNFVDKNKTAIGDIKALETTRTEILVGFNNGTLFVNSTKFNSSNEYINTTNISGWWHFDNSTTDSSKNALFTQLQGNADDNATGRIGYGLELDGDDYVNASGIPFANGTDYFTVEMWVKPKQMTDYGYLGIYRVSNGGGFQLVATGSTNWPVCQSENGSHDFPSIQATNGINVNVWTHLACVFNKSHVILYINGIKNGSAAWGGGMTHNDFGVIDIGRTGGGGRIFNGTIDEVRILNRSLSDQEVYEDYIGKVYTYQGKQGYHSILAGSTNNVSAFAWLNNTYDSNQLLIGTNDGANNGGVSLVDMVNNIALKNYTSGNNEALISYNVTSLSHIMTKRYNTTEYTYVNYTLVGTNAGATEITDYGISASVKITVLNSADSSALTDANVTCTLNSGGGRVCSNLTNSSGNVLCGTLDTTKIVDCTATKATYSADNTVDDLTPAFVSNTSTINMTLQVGTFMINLTQFDKKSGVAGYTFGVNNCTDSGERVNTSSSGLVQTTNITILAYDIIPCNHTSITFSSRTPPSTLQLFLQKMYLNSTTGGAISNGIVESYKVTVSSISIVDTQTTNSTGNINTILESNTLGYNFHGDNQQGGLGENLYVSIPNNLTTIQVEERVKSDIASLLTICNATLNTIQNDTLSTTTATYVWNNSVRTVTGGNVTVTGGNVNATINETSIALKSAICTWGDENSEVISNCSDIGRTIHDIS